ncbi:MAG: WecB/TagA/CpsF family glycosyltransferase [Magnetococcales bacterium]|nr:WecB/TagA/CpsF family glycosyltransferase [Magnetococcales bacterium]MBF0156578.1 WecB/TagA/CpsF family glycosyltransferase [Magnetococcales bacterium]
MKRENILGYPVAAEPAAACVAEIASWIETGCRRKSFVCLNPHAFEVAATDPLFRRSLEAADLITPDGVGILWASRLLGGGIRQRVTGSDIFHGLSEHFNRQGGGRYFFLGSTEENLERLRQKMHEHYPAIAVVGLYSPPFKDEFDPEDNRKMVAAINAAGANLLWVGMTAPKQEKWIESNRQALEVPFIGAIGAVFDFFTGRVVRSSPFFQALGLEWLPRLLKEPRRLWRRNFVSNPRFLLRVLRHRLRHGGTATPPSPG